MGEARYRRVLGLAPHKPSPVPEPPLQRHVLAMIDRRIERQPDGEVILSDHSAKPNTYCSADMKTLYRWDGVCLQRIDRRRQIVDTHGAA